MVERSQGEVREREWMGETTGGRLMSVQQRRLQQADAAWLRLSAGHQRGRGLEGMEEVAGEDI